MYNLIHEIPVVLFRYVSLFTQFPEETAEQTR
jgi:hypothetical protein